MIKLAADGIEEILDEKLAMVASLAHRPDTKRGGGQDEPLQILRRSG